MTLSASISSKPAVLSLEFSCEEVEMVVYFKIYFMIHFPRKTPGGVFEIALRAVVGGVLEGETDLQSYEYMCMYIQYVDIFTSREVDGRRDRQTGEATNIAVPKVGTVGNSAAPPPFGLLTVSRCDDIFFFLCSQSREQRKGQ